MSFDFARPRASALALVLLVPALALPIYLQAGGTNSAGVQTQVQQPADPSINSEAGDDAYVRSLRAHLERRPRDARAWVILARLLAERDEFEEAAQAYEKGLARSSKVAADPAVWCEYADALGMSQGGRLTGRPRELVERALALNPNYPKALEMAGSSEYEQGHYTAALGFWRPLLAAQQPGSQAYTELAAAIARTERLAATSIPSQRR